MKKPQSLNQKLVGIGVPPSYASLIATRKRSPGLQLAVKIYRELGIKLGPIENATPAEISAIERVGAKRLGSVP
jgi:hypothetical protein